MNDSDVLHFAVGRCSRGDEGCLGARQFLQSATIVSPDYKTIEELDKWLAQRAKHPESLLCKCCKGAIPIDNFVKRTCADDGA